jgi:hypothetical protein
VSEFDSQFNALALPLMAERLGDALVLNVFATGGTVPFTGIVHRASSPAPNQTTVDRRGRTAHDSCLIQVTTPNVFPQPDDSITLPDGAVAQVIRSVHDDPDGEYPLVVCSIPHGITSKESRARP